ncbi:MAG: N-acetylglucosamine-6-phosphate deacetylase [Victivallales bacterium]|nr:N-acetylglucosamine-6-phosphate deacetylase [Victivallales bacterium]
MITLLTNCHIISPDYDLENAAILIADGKIRQLFLEDIPLPRAARIIDAAGQMVVPGFIDVHWHERSGADFAKSDDEGIRKNAVDKLKEGVTTLLPTTLTLDEENLAASLRTAAAYVASGVKGCKIPGVHLEGPFINPNCLGAQNPDYVRVPDIAEVRRLNAIFPVLKVSYAPEVEHGAEFAAELLAEGIIPSAVHSAAKYSDFARAARFGLKNLSHFCNQMTGLHHRDIGLVGAGLLHKEVFIELICDKLHICPDMIRLIAELKGVEKIQLISDAMRAAGMPDGEYTLGGLAVIVADGEARLKSDGALAGSTLEICTALKNLYEVTGKPLAELIRTTSWNQAQSLGLEKLGRIEPGYCADIVILSDDFRPTKVFINGELRLG